MAERTPRAGPAEVAMAPPQVTTTTGLFQHNEAAASSLIEHVCEDRHGRADGLIEEVLELELCERLFPSGVLGALLHQLVDADRDVSAPLEDGVAAEVDRVRKVVVMHVTDADQQLLPGLPQERLRSDLGVRLDVLNHHLGSQSLLFSDFVLHTVSPWWPGKS